MDTENRLDMHKLLAAFQQFFREHSASWIECLDYKEAGPQTKMSTKENTMYRPQLVRAEPNYALQVDVLH